MYELKYTNTELLESRGQQWRFLHFQFGANGMTDHVTFMLALGSHLHYVSGNRGPA